MKWKLILIAVMCVMFASLASADSFTDNDGSEFLNGTNTFYNTTTPAEELEGTNTSGNMTSRIIDTTYSSSYFDLFDFWRGYGYQMNDEETNILNTLSYADLYDVWHFNGNATGYINNSAFNQLDGVSNATGQLVDSYDLSGTNSRINGSFSNLPTSTGTVTYWLKMDTSVNGTQYQFFDISDGSSNNRVVLYKASANERLLYYVKGSGSGTNVWKENDGLASFIDTDTWYFWALTWDTGTDTYQVYINGTIHPPDESDVAGTPIGMNQISIGDRFTGGVSVNGAYDEFSLWSRVLTAAEINNLYRRGINRLNLSARSCDDSSCDTESWVNLGLIQPAFNMSGLIANNRYFQYRAEMETDVAGWSPQLINVTGDYFEVPAAAPGDTVNTSMFGVEFDAEDFSFSSTDYTDGFILQFNTSDATTNFITMSSFNVEKTLGGGDSDIDLRVLVDGTQVHEETVRTVGTGDEGSTGTIFQFQVANGVHNITTQWRRSGNGIISVSDIDFNLGELMTTTDDSVNGTFVNDSVTFSNTVPAQLLNFTVYKDNNFSSETYYVLKAGMTATATTRVTCRVDDSAYFVRDVGTSVASASTVYVGDFKPQHTDSIWCWNSNGETVTMDYTLLYFSLADSQNNTINAEYHDNSATNFTNSKTYTAGTYQIANVTMDVVNGTSAFTTAQVSFESDTGEQLPIIRVNSTGVECNTKKERYFSASNSIGNAYIYHMCSGLTTGSTYTFQLFVEVPTGEQVTIYDEALAAFEVTPFDTTETETPSGEISNVVLTLPESEAANTVFDLVINATCVGATCQESWRTVVSPIACTLQAGSENYFIGNWTDNYTETLQYSCNTADPTTTFNVTVNSSRPSSFTASDSLTITAGGGLTDDQSSCLFTGLYVNGTRCSIGAIELEVKMSALTGILLMMTVFTVGSVGIAYSVKNIIGKIAMGLVSGLLLMSCFFYGYLMATEVGATSIANTLLPLYQLSTIAMRWMFWIACGFMLYWVVNSLFSKKHRGTNLDREIDDV